MCSGAQRPASVGNASRSLPTACGCLLFGISPDWSAVLPGWYRPGYVLDGWSGQQGEGFYVSGSDHGEVTVIERGDLVDVQALGERDH